MKIINHNYLIHVTCYNNFTVIKILHDEFQAIHYTSGQKQIKFDEISFRYTNVLFCNCNNDVLILISAAEAAVTRSVVSMVVFIILLFTPF